MVHVNLERNFPFGRLCLPFAQAVDQPVSPCKVNNHRVDSLLLSRISTYGENPRGGGGLSYESDGDARRKIRIDTLKETNLGVAPVLFNP